MSSNAKEITKYDFLNRGVETGPIDDLKPCDQWFLDLLAKELQDSVYKLAVTLPQVHTTTMALQGEPVITGKLLLQVMEEVKRLALAPELFPTLPSREIFLNHVQKLCARFKKVYHVLKKAPYLKEPTVKIMRLNRTAGLLYPSPDSPSPVKASEKPWSKLLRNHATGNGIVQKIPYGGWMVLRRASFMHHVVAGSYKSANRVIRSDKDRNRKALLEATGEDHGDELVTFVRRGLSINSQQPRGHNDVVAIEDLAKALSYFQHRNRAFPVATQIVLEVSRPQ